MSFIFILLFWSEAANKYHATTYRTKDKLKKIDSVLKMSAVQTQVRAKSFILGLYTKGVFILNTLESPLTS